MYKLAFCWNIFDNILFNLRVKLAILYKHSPAKYIWCYFIVIFNKK
ncbi:hypothetical protein AN1V17_48230 [Vallitalea sediminicola]